MSSNALSSMEYMTLSHCWGDSSFLMLTSTNINDFKQGKPLSVLPKLFQDAISVTKLLGCGMIWIDSLCIIQDRLDDWQKESADMARVYANAICNIAATGLSGAHESILQDPDPALITPCIFKATGESQESSRWRVLMNMNVWHTHVYNAPLNKRAWVLQERLLSRRILHFAIGQLFWECLEKEDCEAWSNLNSLDSSISPYIDRVTPQFFRSRLTFEEGGLQLGMQLRHDETDLHKFREMWCDVVTSYTNCKLSVPTDKLPALFGIIDIMQHASNDECLAGLWRSNILAELLWRRSSKDDVGFSKDRFSRAPSWSWTSLDGPISPSESTPMIHHYKAIATIIDARMQGNPGTPLAICSAGSVTLDTYIAKAKFVDQESESYLGYFIFEGFGRARSIAHFDTPIGSVTNM